MLIIDNSEKVPFAMGAGTPHERSMRLAIPSLGAAFDSAFGWIESVQSGIAAGDRQVMAYKPIVPIFNVIIVLWAFAAEDNRRMQETIAQLSARVAQLEATVAPTVRLEVEPGQGEDR